MEKLRQMILALLLAVVMITPAYAARQTLTAKTPGALTAGALAADSADAAFTAADATNKEQVAHTGREILIAYNSGAGARTCTVTSVADDLGRTLDVPNAYSIGAGEYAVFGPYPVKGWRQTNGYLYFEASHAEVKWLVLTIPTWFQGY